MVALYLVLAFVIAYLIGNINFARIFSKQISNKDITQVGSKNPGTMNVLRTQGFGQALLTLLFEALKSGVPSLVAYFLFGHFFEGFANIAYFLVGLATIMGHCFPVLYKFKGGKGVACTFGMFLCHPDCWWIALIMFVVCFVSFFFIQYPFIISFMFIFVLSIFETVFAALNYSLVECVCTICFVWMNVLFVVFMHRGNIKRFATGTENKVNFREKLKSKKSKEDRE